MALNNLGLGFVFTARDMASAKMGKLQNRLGRLQGTSRRTGKMMKTGFAVAGASLVPLISGVATLGSAIKFAKESSQFTQNLSKVANKSGATAEELQQLRKVALEAGVATQFDPADAVKGLESLASFGFNTAKSMTVLEQALAFGEGGGLGIEQAAESAANAISGFGDRAGETATLADRLLAVTSATALRPEEIQDAFAKIGAGARITTQSMDEMLLSIGLMRKTGEQVSVSSSGVSRALMSMASNAKAFEEIGVSVTDSEGNFRDFLDIVLETNTALGEKFTNSAERADKARKLFGQFGLKAFAGIAGQLTDGIEGMNGEILKGADAINFLRQTMTGAAGTAEAFKKKEQDTFEGQMKLLQGSIKTFAINIGEAFEPVFKEVIKTFLVPFNKIIEFLVSLSPQMKKTLGIVIAVTGVFLTFAGALGLIAGLTAVVAPFLLLAAKIFLGLVIAMLPVIAVAGVLVTAIGLIAMAIKKNWGGLGDFASNIFNKVKLTFKGLIELFSQGGFSKAVNDEMEKSENQGIQKFVIGIFKLWHRIKTFLLGVKNGFMSMRQTLEPAFRTVVESVKILGRELGFLGDGLDGLTGGPSKEFGASGVRLGAILGKLAVMFARGLTIAIAFGTAMVKMAKIIWTVVGPIFRIIGAMIQQTIGRMETAINLASAAGDFLFGGSDEDKPAGLQAGRAAVGRNNELTPATRQAGAEALVTASAGSIGGFGGLSSEEMIRQLSSVLKEQPIEVRTSLNVDGEKLAESSARAQRGLQSDGFIPTPAGA